MAVSHFTNATNDRRLAAILGKLIAWYEYKDGCLHLRLHDGTRVMAGLSARMEGTDLITQEILEVFTPAAETQLLANKYCPNWVRAMLGPAKVALTAPANIVCPNHFLSPISGRCYDCGKP